jgi:hypothetical protein
MSTPRLRQLLLASVLVCVTALATACGSSSPASSSTTSADAGTATGATPAPTTTAPRKPPHSDDTVGPTAVHKPYPGTGGAEINDDNPGGADIGAKQKKAGVTNPCALVTREQAEAILAEPVSAPQYAPLGPTCIYQPRKSKSFITISLATGTAADVGRLQKRTAVKAAGHTAYCGFYGQQLVLVPLGGGHTLSVAAPCTVGTKLASAALGSLPA